MSGSDLIFYALNILPLMSIFYAAYWAFDIRHALTVRLYRNQAFGLGVFSLITLLAVLPSPQSGSSGVLGNTSFLLGYVFVTSIFWLGVLNFVDATALVSRRADPLLRDTLHWSKARYVFWFSQIFNVSFIVLGTIFSIITRNPTLANQILQGNNGAFTSIPAIIANLAWILAFGSFVVFVPVAIRAKDPTMRRHLKWLVILAALTGSFFLASGILGTIGGATVANFLSSPAGTLFTNTIFLLTIGYCLYRSARALVPLNRISPLEIAQSQTP